MDQEGVLELLDAVDTKHGEAHTRLRNDYRELENRLDAGLTLLRDSHLANKQRLAELAATPLDATKLMLEPRVVVSIVILVVTIFGGVWATTASLRSDMRDIITRMEAEQRVTDANAKLLDSNNVAITRSLEQNAREMKESISAITKRQELQQLQIQQLQESIVRLTPVGRR